MNKYVLVPRKDKDHELESRWYRHCQQSQVPFVTVKKRTRYADIHWDYITYNTGVDKILEQNAREIKSSAVNIFMKYAGRASSYEVSGHLVWYRNIAIEHSECAASDLYDLIIAVVNRETH